METCARRALERAGAASALLWRSGMNFELIRNGKEERVHLAPGRHSVGRSVSAAIRVDSAKAQVGDLWVAEDRAVFRPRESVEIDGVLSPKGVDRLLLPGERLALAKDVYLRLALPRTSPQATAALALELLRLGGAHAPTDCARLVCVAGVDRGAVFPLPAGEALLGRHPSCLVFLHDGLVSRKHARIVSSGEQHVIEDLQTPNGLYVDGVRTAGPTTLRPGQVIELGHTILKYQVEEPKDLDAPVAGSGVPAPIRRRAPFAVLAAGCALAATCLGAYAALQPSG